MYVYVTPKPSEHKQQTTTTENESKVHVLPITSTVSGISSNLEQVADFGDFDPVKLTNSINSNHQHQKEKNYFMGMYETGN